MLLWKRIEPKLKEKEKKKKKKKKNSNHSKIINLILLLKDV